MIGKFIASAGGSNQPTPWVRPSDWLPMPTVLSTDQTFVGLHAVIENSDNFCAFLFTTNAGQYRVDWGDGTVTLHNSNTIAQYQYNFATVSNSTLTSRGYKQAIITVTPVSGNLLTASFQQRFVTTPNQGQTYSTGFLDCIISMPNYSASQFVLGSSSAQVAHTYMERFSVKSLGSCNNLSDMFNSFSSLQSVDISGINLVGSMRNMFLNCRALKSVPLFNTSNANTMETMFSGCSSLTQLPVFNTQSVTNMTSMFANCTSLITVPLFNTQSVTNMTSMFSNARALQLVPLFNTSLVRFMNNMFNECFSLQTVPLFNTISVTNMSGMFTNCHSLQTIPSFNMQSVTNMSGMMQTCTSLQSIPLLNTSNVRNMAFAVNNCQSINFIPELNTDSANQDFSVYTNQSLNRCSMKFGRSVTLGNQLSATAIEEVLTNLMPRPLTSATLVLSSNWGVGSTFGITATLTNNSTLIPVTSTLNLSIGMQVTGIGSPLTSPVAVTLQDAGDTVTLVNHGLQNNDEISFATVVSTTGFVLNTIYFVINRTVDTFQISQTLGGSPLALTTDGSGTIRHRTEIVSIIPNTSVTMSRPMRGAGSQSLTFRTLRTGTGLLKNWVVTG